MKIKRIKVNYLVDITHRKYKLSFYFWAPSSVFLTNMLSKYLASTSSNNIVVTSDERLSALLLCNVLQCNSIIYIVDS